MPKRLISISVLTVLALAGCSNSTLESPSVSTPASTTAAASSVDWEKLNQEEINDPAPLAEATFGIAGTAELRGLEVSGVKAKLVNSVDLTDGPNSDSTTKTYPSRGRQLLVTDIEIYNNSKNNVYPQAEYSNSLIFYIESKDGYILARADSESFRLGAYWNSTQPLKPGETFEYRFFFDPLPQQKPAYLTVTNKPMKLGYRTQLTDVVARLGLGPL